MTDEIKRDIFGRELPPESQAPAAPPEDAEGPAPRESPDASSAELDFIGAPSDAGGTPPDETPDGPDGPEVPSQTNPEPPYSEHDTPSMHDFIMLRQRVEILESHMGFDIDTTS